MGRLRYYLGLVLILLGASFIPPVVVSLVYGEEYYIGYSIISLALMGLGYAMYRDSVRENLEYIDSLVIAVLSFLIPALANTAVMVLYGFDTWDSLFESVSGITTTGLSMFNTSDLPKTMIFERAWLQWIGGVGIVVMTIGFILKPGTVAYQLFATHLRKEPSMPSVKTIARAVVGLYGALTAIAFIVYTLSGTPVFDSLVYALTTTSTGGFAATSVFPKAIVWPAVVFMFLSSQSFTRYYLAFRGRRLAEIVRSPQIKSFIVLNILSIILFYYAMTLVTPGITVEDAVFNTLSALSTTGYSTIDMSTLPDSGKYILVILMLVGASMGSTGGGIKQYRLIILFKEIGRRIRKAYHPPEEIEVVKIGGKPLGDEEVYSHILIINLYILVLTLSVLAFQLAGYPLVDSLFNTASAIGTVGLQTSMLNNTIEWYLKLVVSIDMFLGRLEILPVIAILSCIREKI